MELNQTKFSNTLSTPEILLKVASGVALAGGLTVGTLWFYNQAAVTGMAAALNNARDNAVTELNFSSPPPVGAGTSERIASWRNDGYAVDVAVEWADPSQFAGISPDARCVAISEGVTRIPTLTNVGVPAGIMNSPRIVGYACRPQLNQNYRLVALPMTVASLTN